MIKFAELNEWGNHLIWGGKLRLVCVKETSYVYPDGRREGLNSAPIYRYPAKTEERGKFCRDGIEYILNKHTLFDGQVYCEEVQTNSWLPPGYPFIALQDEDGSWVPESLWTEDEAKKAIEEEDA